MLAQGTAIVRHCEFDGNGCPPGVSGCSTTVGGGILNVFGTLDATSGAAKHAPLPHQKR